MLSVSFWKSQALPTFLKNLRSFQNALKKKSGAAKPQLEFSEVFKTILVDSNDFRVV
jgi:hypothetical protein